MPVPPTSVLPCIDAQHMMARAREHGDLPSLDLDVTERVSAPQHDPTTAGWAMDSPPLSLFENYL